MNKDKLVENLKKICLNTKPLSLESLKKHKHSKMWMRGGITVFLSQEDIKYYYSIIQEILLDPNISRSFSIADIEKEIEGIISRTLKLKEKNRESQLQKEVDNLIKNLNAKIDEWVFILPIENLKLSKRSITIDGIKLFTFSKYHYYKWLREYKYILDNNPHYTNNTTFKAKAIKNFKDHYLNHLLNETCAKVKVKGTNEGAKQVAIKKIDLVLSCIKLYSYSNDSFYKRYFGIRGEIIPSNIRAILSQKEGEHHLNPSSERTGYLYPFELDKNRLDFMFKNGFNKLKRILNKKDKSDLDKRLLNTIYWYSKAFDIPEVKQVDDTRARTSKSEEVEYFNLGDKFLKLTIALECLLIFDKERKAFNLKTRASYLLTDKKEHRCRLQKYMQKAYATRCNIVHEGSFVVSKRETNEFMNIVQSIIIVLILFKDKWRIKTNEDLYQWFEKNRLSDRLIR